MNGLSGYVFSSLREGDIALYRGSGYGLTPILLVAAEETSSGCVERLEHEYALKSELDADWAARPVALTHDNGRTTLVLEDPGGTPLDQLLGRPLEVSHFLRIAIPLAGALRHVHERGLIHKDVKPANIWVNDANRAVKFTGFGIASRLPRERQSPAPPEIIAGTLAYMAPEQTGRMNRSVDSRSDLYALGVTFYELLTGALPFTAADPIELIHCHIAREPVPPHEVARALPAPLSMIVMKLLAKTAEERYQTAAGVEADLRKCLTSWESFGRNDAFPLGLQDASDRLMIPEKLYGREGEIATLLAAFDRVVKHGGSELVLVSGYSGIGKSSVVNELHKVIVLPRGIFISGKFDLRRRDTPYSTLADAFQGLIRQILSGRQQDVEPWREAVRQAVGHHGSLLTDLIPELAQLVGPQPPVPELSSLETQVRFRQLFQRFVGVFARAEHPLVIFIDDLQWLDPATLSLIEHLVTDLDTRHVLFIGAYRDNEVSPAHPLTLTLERIRRTGTTIERIVLGPLSLDGVSQLLCDALRGEPATVRPLAELVHRKTGGNPFFAGQFLTSLAEEGLLAFDSPSLSWTWDLAGIHRKGHTDNLVDLMISRLQRLPSAAQGALQLLSCLGSQADFATLATIHRASEDSALGRDTNLSNGQMHESFRAALRAELVLAQEGRYRFLHDRVQEAAYALIPSEARADFHLQIGRLLVQRLSSQSVLDNVFDIVNQLNRGQPLLSDWVEKKHLAELDLQAGRKAMRSTAYAAASGYFAAGMTALSGKGWTRCYDLALNLWLERAECELLSSNVEETARLVDEVLVKGRSAIDRAAAYRLRMILQLIGGDATPAVRTALECLTMFGLELPEKPTFDQVQAEYDDVRRRLGGRSIESLIDLPLMDDPETRAAMKIMATLATSSYFADGNLYQMLTCRMVNLTLQRGTCESSVSGYGGLGLSLGPAFHRFEEGERFAKLGVDIAERYGFASQKAGANFFMQMATVWTRPIEHALTWLDAAMQSARETGEIVFACYSLEHRLTNLIARGENLDIVRREADVVLDYARKNKFRHIDDVVSSVQPFVQSLRGSAADDKAIDAAALETRVLQSGVPVSTCYYWILQLRRHFLLGDFQRAIESAEKAQPALWAARFNIRSVDYCFYHSLAIAAVFQASSPERRAELREALIAHIASFQRWAESCPATFAHKLALVSAEWARLEGRDIEAMQLYEQAIRLAAERGFLQDRALAGELAVRFYRLRGLDKVADIYLEEARDCYARWGAKAKVAQLDQDHPRVRQQAPLVLKPTIEAPVEQFDLATVIKMSEAVAGEIVLEKLIETLMVIAVEHAGADRGLLLLPRGSQYRIEAGATSGRDGVRVRLVETPATPSELPLLILEQVIRTQSQVILDDARGQSMFAEDEYMSRKRVRSLLCLPLLKQAELIGVLYLENSLASHVFTPGRIAVLKLLASQAAIALENARLYSDVAEREAKIQRLVDANIIGIFISSRKGEIIEANDAFLTMTGYNREDIAAGNLRLTDLTPPEWRASTARALEGMDTTGAVQPYEKEYVRKDGSRVPVLIGSAAFDEQQDHGVAFVLDLTQRKRAEAEARKSERRYREAQLELVHANRVATMGQLTSSIAHEVNQPLAAVVTYASAARRFLGAKPPNFREVDDALSLIVKEGNRAGEVVGRIRALVKKAPTRKDAVEINDAILEVIALTRTEAANNSVSVRTQLADGLPRVQGDRVQLQQVLLNLIINAIEAMRDVDEEERELLISTRREPDGVSVEVRDSGPGFAPAALERVFEAFYTTKSGGLGLGLSICRSIIEAHNGQLWTSPNVPRGAIFGFIAPAHPAAAS
jgi:PAS domain S-box-containing protein